MKELSLKCIISLLFLIQFAAKSAPYSSKNIKPQGPTIFFTENKGQICDQFYNPRPDVLYSSMTGNMCVHIKRSGISYQLNRIDKLKEIEEPDTKTKRKEIEQQTVYRVDINWLGHNKTFAKTENEVLPEFSNYYLGNCPDGILNVRSYRGITLKNLYNGIDLHYYQKDNELKHDYIVKPGANHTQIQMEIKGADLSINDDGSLILTTPLGKVVEGAPIVYQNGKRLKARWQIKNNTVCFDIKGYNPNFELIIDPITRLWATYYGGNSSGFEEAYSNSDVYGNAYLSGYTNLNSTPIFATTGSHQTTYGGGVEDAFLAKFNTNGNRLWSTYYGGNGQDRSCSTTIDSTGNIFITGQTTSSTSIATNASHQSTFFGGGTDAFLVKFNSNGIRIWGTYYGGFSDDHASSCATDKSGNVYITGMTGSSTNISTAGSHQVIYGSVTGNYDCFLVKFDSSGVRQWGTYYGGEIDEGCSSVKIDATGNVYIAGSTNSYTGIATSGCHQPAFGGHTQDAFMAKFNSNGVRLWGTYYGGYSADAGYTTATDALGNLYFLGRTTLASGTIMATPGCQQSTNSGIVDLFLAKFDTNGVRQWSTFYGGPGFENSNNQTGSMFIDSFNDIYVAGSTDSNTGIATLGTYQSTLAGGSDAFIVKFNGNGVRQTATYYGGPGDEVSYSINRDSLNNIYMSGRTTSSVGIATTNGHQTVYGGGYDAFLVKFAACYAPTQTFPIAGNSITCLGSTSAYSIANSPGASFYTWILPSGWSGSSNTNTISATVLSSGVVTLVAANACGAAPAQTLFVSVNPLPTLTLNSGGQICIGSTLSLSVNGSAVTYSWNNATTGNSIIVTPTVTSTFSVEGTDINGCTNSAFTTVTVNPLPNINLNSSDSLMCEGDEVSLTASGALSYTFSPGGIGASILISPSVTTVYSVTGVDINGCMETITIVQNVAPCTGIVRIENPRYDILFYPNPAKEIINLELEVENEIVIQSALGQAVYSGTFTSGSHQINIENMANGVYFINAKNGTYWKNFKMIKE